MKSIFLRELGSHFYSMTSYILIAFMLGFSGIYVMAVNLYSLSPNYAYAIAACGFFYLLITPILTMRVITDERRQKTDQLLYALPLSMPQIVLGKYFAMLAVLAVPTVVMAVYPLILTSFGPINLAMSYGTLLAFFLLGAALASIGMFVSSLTDNLAVAVGLCFIVMLLNFFITSVTGYVSDTARSSLTAFLAAVVIVSAIIWFITRSGFAASIFGVVCAGITVLCYILWPASFVNRFPRIIESLALFDRFYVFSNGMFDITVLLYYLSVIVFFVYLTIQSMEKRRWS